MNISQQLEQSLKLDEEYNLLFAKILEEQRQLSNISQEFVNFKLKFLENSTLQFQKIQLDERLLRNQQLENLYEYVKMNKKKNMPQKLDIFQQRKFSLHQLNKPTLDQLSQRNQDTQRYQVLNYYQNPTNRATIQTARKSIVSHHQSYQKNENKIKEQEELLKRAMELLEKNKNLYPEQYEILAIEYENYIKNNLEIAKKQQLKNESNKIKCDLDQLLSTSRKFKQFLGKVK